MPELPEVTVIVNGLDKKLKGLIFAGVEYDWPRKFFWGRRPGGRSGPEGGFSIDDLRGAKVKGIRRLGKVVIIDCTRETKGQSDKEEKGIEGFSILIHLKLTGQLIYQDKKTRIAGGHPIPPLNLPSPNKTTRATFEFTNGGHLYFNDLRKFGWVKFVPTDEEKIREAIGVLGPDALEISFKDFADRLAKKPNSRIKKLLMDQTFVSGIGNIYSDEALWLAKVHPARSVASLSEAEIKALHKGIRDAMELAIEKGGSSANSFVGSGGEKGLFLSFAKAYHMTGRPCERCKTPIARKKMDGRSAHFCPACQRLEP
ncbi:bifunctional DNA-formamidopyrimidine glycosylase/DNA-(apurinic or apyrimidinic site) lyase [Candidatus Curtissbacteria bacterium]|nr:bifunctional DNA-formamidopyrimidine glycosylase/DNA-(apurinic or apyrimidinic site) lyase [Candidatus Curtissbacteria bacterium]